MRKKFFEIGYLKVNHSLFLDKLRVEIYLCGDQLFQRLPICEIYGKNSIVAAATKPATFMSMAAGITNTRIVSEALLSTCERRGALALLCLCRCAKKKHLTLSDENKTENAKQKIHDFKNRKVARK